MLLLRRSVAGPLPQPRVRPCALTPLRFPPAERKAKLRQALTETKKEIDEYRAQREVKLRATNPEVRPGAAVPCVCSAMCVLAIVLLRPHGFARPNRPRPLMHASRASLQRRTGASLH